MPTVEHVWRHMFPKHQQKTIALLTPIIGEPAARARSRAGASLLASSCLTLPIIGLATATRILGGPFLLGATLALCVVWLMLGMPIVIYGQRADRLARQHVSAQVGYDIGHITGTAAPGSWLKSIHRMETRRSRQTAREARTQQWLARQQEKSEEYRREHPQDPGQGG